uniref:Carnitine palmitoyltransferase 2 n=1 Tax=Tetraodon nigroviridis TaxID=99883 RepID=H3CZP4_TETNG
MAKLLSVCYTSPLGKPGKILLRNAALNVYGLNYGSKKPSSSDYLQRSLVPTMHYQKSLPRTRLPIPELEDTMRRFVAAQRPLLSDHEFRSNKRKITSKLQIGVGRELHKELVTQDKLNNHTSYMSGPWLDMYLKNRKSLLDVNVFMLLHQDPKTEYNQQLVRATNLTCSALRFMKTLRAGLLEPTVFYSEPSKSNRHLFERVIRWVPPSLSWYGAHMVNAYPLDMSQYYRIFNSTRIPRRGRDELVTHEEGRHIVVMRKGNMYVFDVVDRDGNLLKPAEIQAHLKYILDDLTPAPAFPIGVLSTENRDVWAHLRDKLVHCGNADNLRTMESAIFCLCLDDAVPENQENLWLMSDSCNRWLDKTLSFRISTSGEACSIFEHSGGDGVSVSHFVDVILKDSTERPQVHPASAPAAVDSAAAVRLLKFNLDSELKEGIKKAKDNISLAESQLGVEFMEFRKGGKETLKKCKISPDSMVQLAIQMGFLRLYGQTVPTSESCSMAGFKHGRYEVMMPVSMYTKECAHAFVCQRDQHTTQQLKAMLHQCSDHHRQLIREASSAGQGFFCHLYGLYDLATSKDKELHSLFTDCGVLDGFTLSTTILSMPSSKITFFAPDVPEGFGIHYIFQDNVITCNTSSYLSHSCQELSESIYTSLEDIFTVLEEKPLG